MSNHRVHRDEAYIGTTPQMRYWRRRAEERKAMGLCPRCPNGDIRAVVENYSHCERCLKQQRGYYKPKGGANEQSHTV